MDRCARRYDPHPVSGRMKLETVEISSKANAVKRGASPATRRRRLFDIGLLGQAFLAG